MIVWLAYKSFPLASMCTGKDYFLFDFFLSSGANQRLNTVFGSNDGMTYKIFPLADFVTDQVFIVCFFASIWQMDRFVDGILYHNYIYS